MTKERLDQPVLSWERLKTVREDDGILDSKYMAERAKVPGGWLVLTQFHLGPGLGLVFLPDPKHEWDGGSVS